MRTVALYGNSLALSSIAASLEGRAGLRIVPAQQLGAIQPDVIFFDLAAPRSDFDIALWKAQPRVLLIGVDLGSNRMYVLSGQPSRVLTFENLYEAIQTIPEGKPEMIRNKKYLWFAFAGAVVAALLVYFSMSWPPVSRSKVQGAIGQRDVYRQAQLNDQDVGVAGQAKVTVDDVRNLLQSPEFKTLAKDPQFQKMLAQGKSGDLGGLINQVKSQAHSDQMKSQAHSDQMVAQAHPDQMVSQAHSDQMVSQAHSDQMVSQAHSGQAQVFSRPDSQAAFTAIAGNARLTAVFSLMVGSQALQSLAQTGALSQATASGAVQNSIIQAAMSGAMQNSISQGVQQKK